jgi:hypothetical protein
VSILLLVGMLDIFLSYVNKICFLSDTSDFRAYELRKTRLEADGLNLRIVYS